MEVILLDKVRNLGNLGDKVSVKPGYGRNYLIPKGRAVIANEANVAAFEERRAELEKKAQEALDAAKARGEKLAALAAVSIAVQAGEEGKMFGSVGTSDIADAISAAGVEVEKREVLLPEGTIRQIGEYDIEVQLHSDVSETIKLSIVAE